MGSGLEKKTKSLSDRLGQLEQGFTRFLVGVNQRLQGADQRLAMVEETLAALVELNGVDDVTKLINEKRIERARQEAVEEKAKLDKGIEEGYVLVADVVGERSLVVGRHVGKDGTVVEPGRVQLVVPNVVAGFKEKLLGQPAGAKLAMPDGNGEFEVLEVYNVDDEKFKALAAARQKAAQEKQAAVLQAAQAAGETDEQAEQQAEAALAADGQ